MRWSIASGAELGPDPITAVEAVGDGAVIVASLRGGAGVVQRFGADRSVGFSRTFPVPVRVMAAGAGVIAVALEGEADGATVAAAGLEQLPDGLRGTPGGAVVGLGTDGAIRWTTGVGATRWALVRALAVDGDDVLVGGTFAGTLRVGDVVVTAAGNADGFWARLDRTGAVRSLARMGGDGFDAVAGIDALPGGRIAIGGTFTGTVELAGTELASPTGDQVAGDGFAAVLEPDGTLAWVRTWGGDLEDTCAGVGALAGGELAIAGTVSGDVEVAGRRMSTSGPSDGVVAVLGTDGSVRGVTLVGGADVDSITALATGGAGLAVVTGRFSGTIATRAGAVAAPAADAAFAAVVDRDGVVGLTPLVMAGGPLQATLAADARGWLVGAHASAAPDGAAAAVHAAVFVRPW